MKTTRFVDNQNLEFVTWENCHEGVGPFSIRDIIGSVPQEEKEKGFLKFLHEDIIPPGSTFGYHKHDGMPQEEWYYCQAGEGIMVVDDSEWQMRPGDIAVCRMGGCHAIRNEGTEDLHILVIYASHPAE